MDLHYEMFSLLDQRLNRTVWMLIIVVALVLGCTYVRTWYKYHHTNRSELVEASKVAEIPPLYPSVLPLVGNGLSFAWDTGKFLRRATYYAGRATTTRVSMFPGFQIYLFQDRETIKRLFKHPAVASPVPIYTFAMQHFFGMPERSLKVYRADYSGSKPKPNADCMLPADSRPFHATHKALITGLTGSGLGPNTRRFAEAFFKSIQTYQGGTISKSSPTTSAGEWIHVSDMFHFIRHTVGAAMVESHFGPTLLRLSPGYVGDLWKVDAGIPWFSRRVPRFFVPEAYRARERMIRSLTDWYAYARVHFDESAIDEDGDGDPIWGSSLSRHRQKTLPGVREHDDRAMASLDVGHSWGSSTNVVAAAFMAAHHIFADEALLSRVRTSLAKTLDLGVGVGDCDCIDASPNLDLEKNSATELLAPKILYGDTLLCSIYAEILRLHGMGHLLVSAPRQTDIPLGRWLFPRGSLGLLNAGLAHMDVNFWNTRNGQYPVDKFWPERFIVNPRDPQSGPVNPACLESPYPRPHSALDEDEPYFCMDGTEGAWFPYGGGGGICPGRFLAKNAVLISLAYLVMEFDIEPQVKSMVVNPWRYGLGINQPKHATPFRIRKRQV